MQADIADGHRSFEEVVELVHAPKLPEKIGSITVTFGLGVANALQDHLLRVGVGFDVLAKTVRGPRPRVTGFTVCALRAWLEDEVHVGIE
jgi:hypothetical protein